MQVHSCHGPARQVDVLREVLLGLLQDDPTLEPRDILVMCPDIETYAPLIVADFGLGDVVHGAHPAHRLRVKLADRSLIQTNPLLGLASQLLALAGSRVTASEVLNIAEAAPVRARFGFTDDDLESITRWVRQANIRWGFDQRASAAVSRRLRAQHVAFRYRPDIGRRRDVGRRARLDRQHPAARRRQQQPRRIGRPARRIRLPARAGGRLAHRRATVAATGWPR